MINPLLQLTCKGSGSHQVTQPFTQIRLLSFFPASFLLDLKPALESFATDSFSSLTKRIDFQLVEPGTQFASKATQMSLVHTLYFRTTVHINFNSHCHSKRKPQLQISSVNSSKGISAEWCVCKTASSPIKFPSGNTSLGPHVSLIFLHTGRTFQTNSKFMGLHHTTKSEHFSHLSTLLVAFSNPCTKPLLLGPDTNKLRFLHGMAGSKQWSFIPKFYSYLFPARGLGWGWDTLGGKLRSETVTRDQRSHFFWNDFFLENL